MKARLRFDEQQQALLLVSEDGTEVIVKRPGVVDADGNVFTAESLRALATAKPQLVTNVAESAQPSKTPDKRWIG